jgi:hypothetical protein
MNRNTAPTLVAMVHAHIKANESELSMMLFEIRLNEGGNANGINASLTRKATLREIERMASGMATCLDPATSEEDAMQVLRQAREEIRKSGEGKP